MDNYNKKTYELIFFLFIGLFLVSCSSKSHLIKPNQTNDIEIANNFSLEGKFKVSMLDSKETGYFFLKKNNNSSDKSDNKSSRVDNLAKYGNTKS